MYENPINLVTKQFDAELTEALENYILKRVLQCGVIVNKDELLKALYYDRHQYNKGYADGVQAMRQKGIWLDDEGNKKENGYCGNCSVCGVMSEYLTDYCPHCGADMRDELKGESNANA